LHLGPRTQSAYSEAEGARHQHQGNEPIETGSQSATRREYLERFAGGKRKKIVGVAWEEGCGGKGKIWSYLDCQLRQVRRVWLWKFDWRGRKIGSRKWMISPLFYHKIEPI
jgi:hypothetical protein